MKAKLLRGGCRFTYKRYYYIHTIVQHSCNASLALADGLYICKELSLSCVYLGNLKVPGSCMVMP